MNGVGIEGQKSLQTSQRSNNDKEIWKQIKGSIIISQIMKINPKAFAISILTALGQVDQIVARIEIAK